jgi:hypothetical protein
MVNNLGQQLFRGKHSRKALTNILIILENISKEGFLWGRLRIMRKVEECFEEFSKAIYLEQEISKHDIQQQE